MSTIKIIIADDEPDILEFTGRALKAAGLEVIKAENGLQAVDFARSMNPDIVVLDIMMPVMTGYEACRILRSDPRHDDCIIVFFSALSESMIRAAGVNTFYDEYIPKPVPIPELRRKILGFLSERGKI